MNPCFCNSSRAFLERAPDLQCKMMDASLSNRAITASGKRFVVGDMVRARNMHDAPFSRFAHVDQMKICAAII